MALEAQIAGLREVGELLGRQVDDLREDRDRWHSHATQRRPAQTQDLMMFTVRMKLGKETKGALRYQEVDDADVPVEQIWTKIGTLYIRKTAFWRGAEPSSR